MAFAKLLCVWFSMDDEKIIFEAVIADKEMPLKIEKEKEAVKVIDLKDLFEEKK